MEKMKNYLTRAGKIGKRILKRDVTFPYIYSICNLFTLNINGYNGIKEAYEDIRKIVKGELTDREKCFELHKKFVSLLEQKGQFLTPKTNSTLESRANLPKIPLKIDTFLVYPDSISEYYH